MYRISERYCRYNYNETLMYLISEAGCLSTFRFYEKRGLWGQRANYTVKAMRIGILLASVAALPFVVLPAKAENTKAPNNPVIATVDGAKIFRSDIDLARAQLPEQFRTLPMDQIFTPLVNQLIRSKLIATRARATKLDTSVLYKRRLALLKDRLLGEMLLDKMIGDRVDEEALRARYRETITKLPSREEIRARHILVKTKDEALSLVKELIAGADFAALAVAKSIGPSKSRGGDLDYFGRGQMVPPFEQAAFALAQGEFTKVPVQSPFGWHIIKVEDRRRSKPPTFEESRPKLVQDLSEEITADLVKSLITSAKIERFEADGTAPRLKLIQPSLTR